jgi:hypothetical protein
VKARDQQYGYAVNLFDRDELDIRMRDGAGFFSARHVGQTLGQDESTSASSIAAELEVLMRLDYRPVLILLIALLLALEWALYHRRWHL